MITEKSDDDTPHPRLFFEKDGFHGKWYTAVDGSDRCPAAWVGPCPYCHRVKKKVGETAEQIENLDDGELRRRAEAAGKRLYGQESEDDGGSQVQDAIRAHQAGGEVVSESLQYAYVYNK